ncbi:MAG: hypothetical protein NDP13_05525 [Crenarchaeota archaeon]|nr:hypothetical protein [Thermoproteota archaeon]
MELLEALVRAFILTTALLASIIILDKKLDKRRRKVKVHGPFIYSCAYKLDESGALKEVPVESVPKELVEKFQQKVTEIQELLSRFKPPEEIMRGLDIIFYALFALAFFILNLIYLLSV